MISNEFIFSVSDINEAAKTVLEQHFFSILLEGEISNFSCPSSGHWYFSLKDEKAQIRCAMFRMQNAVSNFYPKDGMHVIVKAKLTVYAQRGEYQLIVSHIEEIGLGLLQKRFDQLKEKLFKVGLFDVSHKSTLPLYPKTIGIITSLTGAAIKDVLSVLKRRYPLAEVIIYPTLVQGNEAAHYIVDMIERANKEKKCEVLLLTRGGGSLEDLWPFNEEKVAYAIFNSAIPLITGIGHEIDFTIADLVADVRAPTPSAAAEMLVPDQEQLQMLLMKQLKRLLQAWKTLWQDHNNRLSHLSHRLYQQHPNHQIKIQKQSLLEYKSKLALLLHYKIKEQKNRLYSLAKQLHQLSPLNTMERGYSILFHDERVVNSIKELKSGDFLKAKLKDGFIHCHVVEILD